MNKQAYRSVPVERATAERLSGAVGNEGKGIVGIDLAKRKIYASFASARGQVGITVRFEHPKETRVFIERVSELAREQPIDVVLESTGTYGDPIRYQLMRLENVTVFDVAPKRVHDAAEVFDGVPSLHDAKACAVMTQLHVQGATRKHTEPDEARREMRALVDRRQIYALPERQLLGRIEGELARHWPEGLDVLEHWRRTSALALLVRFPSPADVAAHSAQARELLRTSSRGALRSAAIDAILDSAAGTTGEPMTPMEKATMQDLAREALRMREQLQRVDAEIEALAKKNASTRAIAPVAGDVTAVVLVAVLGSFDNYSCAAALEKACGLNLKLRSSGEHVGRLRISKRGSSVARQYLFMAALRLIQSEPLLRAWYQARTSYRHGQKLAAVVAVMRKIIRALWHVARGERFDVEKLVDSRRLRIEMTEEHTSSSAPLPAS
jgi:transposase